METRRGATSSSEIGGTEVPEAYVEFAKRLASAAGEVTTKYFRARTLARIFLSLVISVYKARV